MIHPAFEVRLQPPRQRSGPLQAAYTQSERQMGMGAETLSTSVSQAVAAEGIVARVLGEHEQRPRWTALFRGTRLGTHVLALIAFGVLVTLASQVNASTPSLHGTTEQRLLDDAIGGKCVPAAAHDVLRAFKVSILNAPTTEDARELVLSQTRLAKRALSAASFLLPFSATVGDAEDKIGELEARLYAANTQTEVASDFAEFLDAPAAKRSIDAADAEDTHVTPMLLAGVGLDETAVTVNDADGDTEGCEYTTGEIIVIVIGFLLFIIPGIIFLIILC